MDTNINSVAQIFFEKLGVDFKDLSVFEETKNIYKISIKSDDSNILIWPHWKNLEVIAHLLQIICSHKLDEKIRIHLEVNDYLEKKDEKLHNFIQVKIDYVKSSGKEIILPFLTAYERKKVHSYVGENWGNVFTQSIGEWKDRRIHLCRKDEKMTIDIDGDDI